MTLSWRRLRAGRRAAKEGEAGDMELTIPNHFRCPISLELMKDPVTLSTGITYDRQSIETWIEAGNFKCPITNQVLTSFDPIPNHTIRKMIQGWCVEKKSFGIERIPTPRIPISSVQVTEILSKITTSSHHQNKDDCQVLVAKINALAKESERNKRCIVASGTGSVLAGAFNAFSSSQHHQNVAVLEEILSALTLVFPLDKEANLYLGSPASLCCMVWFLESGDLSQRRNASLVLKETAVSSDHDHQKTDALAEIEGALEVLVKLIKEPVCPTSTKASLVIMYRMVNSSSSSPSKEQIKERFVEMGLVSLLSDILVDAERSICEKALGVLDGLCGSKQGREKAYLHALTMPVVVKKILRVSDLATEFSVSILWKLCKNETREDGGVLVEALQVGAFQKLLLLLQVGCAERTKDKATDLLKALNIHRERLECIDSMDFKQLKRPF